MSSSTLHDLAVLLTAWPTLFDLPFPDSARFMHHLSRLPRARICPASISLKSFVHRYSNTCSQPHVTSRDVGDLTMGVFQHSKVVESGFKDLYMPTKVPTNFRSHVLPHSSFVDHADELPIKLTRWLVVLVATTRRTAVCLARLGSVYRSIRLCVPF